MVFPWFPIKTSIFLWFSHENLPFVCEEESVHFPLPPFQLELSGPNDQPPNDPSGEAERIERVGHVRRGGMGISCG